MAGEDNFAPAIDNSVWKTVAGSFAKIPPIGSRVRYFPEGHAENIIHLQCTKFTSVSIRNDPSTGLPERLPPYFSCQVTDVQYLVDLSTEHVVAKLELSPINDNEDGNVAMPDGIEDLHGEGEEEPDVVSFTQILSSSDTVGRDVFFVPNLCAESIFPPQNGVAAEQFLTMTDTQGMDFEFRYTGSASNKVLTNGWNEFVNAKRLEEGDVVVFMRKINTEKLFIGVRKALKDEGLHCTEHVSTICHFGFTLHVNNGDNELRLCESDQLVPVLQAMEKALKSSSFEVLYYPRPGLIDFVVTAEMVERSTNLAWHEGVDILIARKIKEDSPQITWFQGTVSGIQRPRTFSPWRMLQIKWDDVIDDIIRMKLEVPITEILLGRVSPWEVVMVE